VIELNPVLMLAYNNLNLTQDAVASAFSQDIPVALYLVDNGSNDGTIGWAKSLQVPSPHKISVVRYKSNVSPVRIFNWMFEEIFRENKYVLTMPNDVILPANTYSQMLQVPRGIVAATQVERKEDVKPPSEQPVAVNENIPMAVALIRKWAHEALVAKDGHFYDEGYFHYASDCDLALRLAACGIRGVQLDLNYWHYGSASWRLATKEIAREITSQADVDRSYFEKRWGFRVDDPRYMECIGDINFRG
jgi:GT2 family glycosyltransferase